MGQEGPSSLLDQGYSAPFRGQGASSGPKIGKSGVTGPLHQRFRLEIPHTPEIRLGKSSGTCAALSELRRVLGQKGIQTEGDLALYGRKSPERRIGSVRRRSRRPGANPVTRKRLYAKLFVITHLSGTAPTGRNVTMLINPTLAAVLLFIGQSMAAGVIGNCVDGGVMAATHYGRQRRRVLPNWPQRPCGTSLA